MSEYLKLWIQIIETMSNDNTYKLAWGKALIEILVEDTTESEKIVITFKDIGYKMLKYYWNQIFFFNLKQSPGKKPVIVRQTETCIERYIEITDSTFPKWFDYADEVLKTDSAFYDKVFKQITQALKPDVSWRFLKSNGEELPIYLLDRKDMTVTFTRSQANEIKHYSWVLAQLLNYKWAELLEKFNSSPRIIAKVKGLSESKITRNSLKKYKDILVANMPEGVVDFYTGKPLPDNDISVDHVIPWSFMYSDDIWNLVITSCSNNSRKSNRTPSDEDIERLKKRNENLSQTIKDQTMKEQLLSSISENYVSKFYIALKL